MQRGTTATDRGTAGRQQAHARRARGHDPGRRRRSRRPARPSSVARATATGLEYARVFAREGVDPFDEIEWDTRSAVIGNEKGALVFEQRDVEVPKFWSQQATNIVVSKYFRGTLGTPGRERSVKQLVGRVVDTITGWARKQRYFASEDDLQAFSDDLKHLLVYQKAAFNSPVWFNVGIEPHPQCSACFINAVQDTMDSILGLAKTEGMLFKYGSGTGSNLSAIRSSKELLAGGGTASGPVSFMKGFDAFAGVIKSGGKTRRAAKMVILNADHPDIVEFINCKVEEEKKAWALIDAGYDGSFTGPAYASVFFQNSNNSVRVTDEFMRAVLDDKPWQTPLDHHRRGDGHLQGARPDARRSPRRRTSAAIRACSSTRPTNDWHTCPNTARINASNPCSEYMFLDDSACNLASINLMKFVDDQGEFDAAKFGAACRNLITAQEILVDNSSYPTRAIERNSHAYRPLGLGYANLGALLMSRGLPYDSDAGRDYAATITAIMHGEAYAQSSRVARDHGGPFAGYEMNREPMLRVMRKHRAALKDIDRTSVPKEMFEAAKSVWDECVELGEQYGYRNAQATVLAPTGTIGFMMDCDTTGVEPDIALVKYKKLVGGGMMKIVNQTVPSALQRLGYSQTEIAEIVEYIDEHETIEGAPHVKDAHLPVFDCAFKPFQGQRSIQYMGHIRMMGATQPFLSGAISKTVNVPKDATVEDIQEAYIESWRLGAKAVSIYRDGSKRTQPLNTSKDNGAAAQAAAAAAVAAAADPAPAAGRARVVHAQVRHRGPRGLHHRRPLRGRLAGRDLPGDGQGGLDDLGLRRRLRAGDLLRAAVRRAAPGARGQVQPRALRALGHDQEPRDPLRQVDRRLRLPLDGGEVPLGRGQVQRRPQRARAGRGDRGRSGHAGDAAAAGGAPPSRRPLARRSRRCRTRKTRRRARPAARSWCAAAPATSAPTAARRAAVPDLKGA